MHKYFVLLAILGASSASTAAQTSPPAPTAPATTSTGTAQPQMVKKRVCQQIEDENPYSRLGTRKICKTVLVPATSTDKTPAEQASTTQPDSGR